MSEKLSLLSDSSDEGSEVEFKINKSYADKYNIWRNKEELQKLKDLSKEISESSSESEEEVEPVIEKDFLKTLSLLKSKDPRIYDKEAQFFTEEPVVVKKKEKKEKPMFLKDYERTLVVERNGVLSEDEDEKMASKTPTTLREEAEAKKSLIEALRNSDEEDDGDDLLKVRTKTETEKEKEEEDYKKWLETEKDMLYLNRYWNDPKLDEGEKFLKDYILNKRYIGDDQEDSIPTYNEITGDFDNLSEDEETIAQQELFEHKYNFRFEEPDEEFIKSFPRTVGDSLRRANTKRKQKREDYAERKKREKEQKREELKRLKALKRKEIEEKFLKLKEVVGKDELTLGVSDMESDFDPDKHDQKMMEMFNDDYYNVEEEQKPEFEYDEEIDEEDWDHWTRVRHQKNNDVNDEGEEGCNEEVEEVEPKHDSKVKFEQEIIESTQSKRKKKRKKSLFARILSQPKPLFDPDGKSFEEYLEEYYKMDYEDIVGDMPVRYKYRKVMPNDFGLTVDEILAAEDKELNRWCSVKKTYQYRRDDEEKGDIKNFQIKARNFYVKKRILQSVYSPPQETEEMPAKTSEVNESVTEKKRKKRSKKKKNPENSEDAKEDSNLDDTVLPDAETECVETVDESAQKSKRKKKKKKSGNLSVENGEMNGILANDEVLPDAEAECAETVVESTQKSERKKKKKKSGNLSVENGEINEELVLENSRNENGLAEENERVSCTNFAGNEEIEMNENGIKSNKKSKKRKLDSLEEKDSFSMVESINDGLKVKDNLKKKKKRDSTMEADSSFNERNNSPTKKPRKDRRNENDKPNKSFNGFSNPRNRNFERNNNSFNPKFKNKNKRSDNNQQPFPGRRKFHNSDFHPGNKTQNKYGSEQVLDCFGKKIVASNSRLDAFQINAKKLANKIKYGKKRM
ncbi:protein KRI1 homolog [Trichonephila inaurata madagascariensis]|uniref:Protein KRI1 homolog n=1 Tax=Trichonephila inaurata madagascariensis TaxID=2747483 RepID=A0A8X6WTV4_9ARAC|nr:protein KRI1 homolog [Trichonephila inaurata madagascariensis]